MTGAALVASMGQKRASVGSSFTRRNCAGLLGAFIVDPKDRSSRPAYDREYTLILDDGPVGNFTINGKSFPATQPLPVKKGKALLIRYMNEGLMIPRCTCMPCR